MKNILVMSVLGFIVGLLIVIGCAMISFTSYTAIADNNSIDKSGCCSHHKGVCSCQGNRTMCCDNTFSPSCKC